jgi:hypothetical protein
MSSHLSATPPDQSIATEVRRRVGVSPEHAIATRSRLLASLQELYPVAFEPRAPGDLEGLDGMLHLESADLPASSVRALAISPARDGAASAGLVEFASSELVERPLRGRGLLEKAVCALVGASFQPGDTALATIAREPVWWRRAGPGPGVDVSAFALRELGEDETLRDHLRPGRFMGLVPLLHFLRDVCEERRWREQPLRASFVIDDPNLHWPSYGFLNYFDLVSHATAHGYHVGLAMVPLDGWLVNRRAASLLRANGASLSLLVHGNDHTARELGELSDERAAVRALGQALRRVASFERRSGVAVGRVMAPPHGACAEPALAAMFRLGFDAACISRPRPWRDRLPPLSSLEGWHPAEMVAGGIPVLPRHHLDASREELVFRALLRQPLILYGHHWDFAQGLDAFAQATTEINSLGDVRWGPLDWIASHNYRSRQYGELLVVEMCSRRALVEIPAGARAVSMRTPMLAGDPAWRGLACGGDLAPLARDARGWCSPPIAVRPGAQVELSLPHANPQDPNAAARRTAKPWPVVRRVLVEARDRARPLLGG